MLKEKIERFTLSETDCEVEDLGGLDENGKSQNMCFRKQNENHKS